MHRRSFTFLGDSKTPASIIVRIAGDTIHFLFGKETIKSTEELRAGFAQRGATPDKEIVFYCRLSHRASLAWFAARYLLKYNRTKIYDGSWTEWGNLVGFPIENKSLFPPIPPSLAR
jgi:3-mercaptopyruvate sulfurtransferase SseA